MNTVPRFPLLAAAAALAVAASAAGRAAGPEDGIAPAAPCAPVVEEGTGDAEPAYRAAAQYSIGEPTGEEQHLLELMNRARLDPDGEADRILRDYDSPRVRANLNFYVRQRPGVEFTRAESAEAFRGYAARPPLAFNEKLMAAARGHSSLMRQFDVQSHQVTAAGEPNLGQRIADTGYARLLLQESVFAFAESALMAHAAFAVDWGQSVPPGESRPRLGHRLSLMDFLGAHPSVEVGISMLVDSSPKTKVGPRVVTVDFGEPADTATRFVTGVCWTDVDGDGFYTPGEGLGGVRIESPASAFFAVSSASGGYALPVAADAGTITVTATGEAGGPSEAVGVQSADVTLAGGNVKLDFTTPPDPAPPAPQTFAAAVPVDVGPGAAVAIPVAVPAFDAENPLIGGVDVGLTIAAEDMSRVSVSLRAPSGKSAFLSNAGPALASLSGSFDATLSPAESSALFEGDPYAGAWTVQVTQDDGAGSAAVVSARSISIRPRWIRTLDAPRSLLSLASLRTVDSAKPGADSITLSGTLDASGRALDAGAPAHLRLLDAAGTEIQRFDVAALQASKLATLKVRTGVGGTSKAAVTLALRKQDFAAPLPSPLTLELAAGGALARTAVPLKKGAYNGAATLPAAPFFRVDSLSSTGTGAARTTTVKGRLAGTAAAIPSLVEVFVGDGQGKLPAAALKLAGTRLTGKGTGLLRSATIDTSRGTFVLTLKGAHEPLTDGRAPVLFRVGTVLGEAEVAPRVSGTSLRY